MGPGWVTQCGSMGWGLGLQVASWEVGLGCWDPGLGSATFPECGAGGGAPHPYPALGFLLSPLPFKVLGPLACPWGHALHLMCSPHMT